MPHGAIPFPFGDCQVCGDKATGVHYGVATCEGCKVRACCNSVHVKAARDVVDEASAVLRVTGPTISDREAPPPAAPPVKSIP